VRFRLDGEDLPVPRGDTSLTEEPVDRSDYAELLALPSPTPATPPDPDASPAPDSAAAASPVPDSSPAPG